MNNLPKNARDVCGHAAVSQPWHPRLLAGLLGFVAGCTAFQVSQTLANSHAAPLHTTAVRVITTQASSASRANIDDDSWKCVSLYRGQPKNPALQVKSASQVGQDQTILDIFKSKRGGTFLDLASNDAVILSNTLALEQQHNWTGLCVEPNPMYSEGYLHRTCRLIRAVVGPEEGLTVDFNFRGKVGAMGGIMGFDNPANNRSASQRHYTVSVAKILRDFGMPKTIDYLSLDIEGAEAWVFETFPWDEFKFLVATIERPQRKLQALLTVNGYKYMCDHGAFGDQLWVHESLPGFGEVAGKYVGRARCR